MVAIRSKPSDSFPYPRGSVVGVAVRDDEAAKERAADALRAAHAESLHYYAKNYVEDLGGDA